MVSRRACAALALVLLAVAGAHAAEKLKITILASRGSFALFAVEPPSPSTLGRLQTFQSDTQRSATADLTLTLVIRKLSATAAAAAAAAASHSLRPVSVAVSYCRRRPRSAT